MKYFLETWEDTYNPKYIVPVSSTAFKDAKRNYHHKGDRSNVWLLLAEAVYYHQL
jgi:hypothetical protein